MRLIKITIGNFKGSEYAEIFFEPRGENIYTLIGLNESGKTTILEAISTFNFSKKETEALYGANAGSEKPTRYVPKGLKSNFTGDITVEAEFEFETGEKEELIKKVIAKTGAKIILSEIPEKVTVTRGYRFENSDYKERVHTVDFAAKAVLKGKKRRFKLITQMNYGIKRRTAWKIHFLK